MRLHKSSSWVLWYECVGFALIILFCWVDELTGAGNFIYGRGAHSVEFGSATLQTLLILLVWAVVFFFTKRLVSHLHYLEGFLRVCSWCRRIGYQDKWIPLEEYFDKDLHVGTTHGVCPSCMEKWKEDTTRFLREEVEKSGRLP